MMCFKAIVLVSAIACLVSAEKIPLKEQIFKCKLLQLKKHHSILESLFPSIVASPVDPAVPGEYTVPDGVTTVSTDPAPGPTAVPVAPQQEEHNPPPQEVQYPPQPEVQYPPQPEVQYPTQPEVQYPTQPEVQYPTQPEVQYPVPQQEGQPPAAPQQEVQNPPQQRPLYPPQHEVQRPAQHHVEQNPPLSNEGLYPPQHNVMQYYPPQNEGPYYQPQNEGVYYPPPNYQGFATNNVPYNYPVYGQNVLRSVKSLDGQTYVLHRRPYGLNMLIRKPTTYYSAPPVYDQYAAPQYNYVSQAPRTAQALTGAKSKST